MKVFIVPSRWVQLTLYFPGKTGPYVAKTERLVILCGCAVARVLILVKTKDSKEIIFVFSQLCLIIISLN